MKPRTNTEVAEFKRKKKGKKGAGGGADDAMGMFALACSQDALFGDITPLIK